jgi:hypothetical protein
MCANINKSIGFISGGGEMGELTRAKDWSQTPVGPPETWPQSLRTTLSIILNSKFPMFLWWGPELICFYNDAYRPSLGQNGKHPAILGQPAAQAWPEIWDVIKPLIDQVLAGGEATWSEDQLIPIYRNGKLEDVYWTFSYSPVNNESGKVAGVLVTCSETTDKVNMLRNSKDREDQLNFTIDAAELGTWDLNPATNKFVGNSRLKEWFGLTPTDEIELEVAIKSIAEDDRDRVLAAIQKALTYESGGNYQIEYTIVNPLTKQKRRVLVKGKALFNAQQQPYKFSGTLQDITLRYNNQLKVEASEKRFRNTVMQMPLGITILRGPQFIPEMANETYLQLVDRTEANFVGRPLFDSLPEVKDVVEPLLNGVMTTGEAFHATELSVTLYRYGKREVAYFDLVYHPYRETDGSVTGIIVVATEVTKSVEAKHQLQESEKQFRNLVMQSPIPMTIFRGPDNVIEMANRVMFEKIWRKTESEVIGKKLLDVFPELKEQKYPELLNTVYTTGIMHREKESAAWVQGNDGLQLFYLDFEYSPFYTPTGKIDGIVVTVNDVTEKVEARQRIQENEEKLNIVISASELGIWEYDLITQDITYSERYLQIFGYSEYAQLTHNSFLKQIHTSDLPVRAAAFEKAYATGTLHYETRIIWPDNTLHWIDCRGKVFFDANGKPAKMIGTIRDITEDKAREQVLLESEQKFRLLADSMPQHIWTADNQGNLNYFNQSVYTYSGLSPEKLNEVGWLDIVHPDDRPENTSLWKAAVTTGNDFLFEHRFRRHDGTYRWQLSRAKPQLDEDGKIQMWVGTSTDIHDQKTFSNLLEKQVQERTAELEIKNKELQKMNTELQSFAYVSSHDLQEPLRKIQTFAARLLDKEHQNLSEQGKDYFERMRKAARRMQILIDDLLTYSRTNTTERNFEETNLNEILEQVKADLAEDISSKQAELKSEELPTLKLIPFQFKQLLHNLIGNAIKFSRPDVAPFIQISITKIEGANINLPEINPHKTYYKLSIADNGIGFEAQYSQRIFEVFQRLHGKDEYKGTGIGLAIVKKIVENHHGIITATGEPDKGATFDIYIPEE